MSSTKDLLNNAKATVPAPLPLEHTIPKVDELTRDMLPPEIRDFVFDVAERAQCPAEFVAIAALVTLSSLIGGTFSLHPKQHDNWQFGPNIWGSIIGPPSAMKSPAVKEVMRILTTLEQAETKANDTEIKRQKHLYKLQIAASKAREKDAEKMYIEGSQEDALKMMVDAEPDEITEKPLRLIVNDTTIEKLGEIMHENPEGLLYFRDELAGLLGTLAREDRQSDRGFILECYDSFGPYTVDRIGRGSIVIPRCILSILGSIQPSKIQGIVNDAMSGRIDDGLIQRMQLSVWPDIKKGKKWKDQSPDPEALNNFESIVHKLYRLRSNAEPTIEIRFSPDAQTLFMQFWEQLQHQIEDDDLHPIMQSHLGKMPKTIGSLALIFQLCTDHHESVDLPAMELAVKWYKFLQSHAHRLYSAADTAKMEAAKRLLARKDKLDEAFSIRDVRRKHWAGLRENSDIEDAINILLDHYYLIEIQTKPGAQGGRPTTRYKWNSVQPKSVNPAQFIVPKPAETKL